MRKILPLLLFLVPILSFSQSDTLTKLDKFISATPGAMIKKENIVVGKFKNGNVKLYKLTNLRSNTNLKYVMIDYEGNLGSTGGQIIINMEELPGIIDAIEFLSKASFKQVPENEEEYYYTTTDNIRLYLINRSIISKGWHMGLGKQYYYTSSFRPGQHILIRPSQFDEIVPILKKSQSTDF